MITPPAPIALLDTLLNPSPLVPWERLHARAKELAGIAGRTPENVSQQDYEEAKRELTGEWDLNRQEAKLEALPPEPDRDSGLGSGGPPPTLDSGGQAESEKHLEVDRLEQRRAGEALRNHALETTPSRTESDSTS